jgi:SAM-dependent methyltransferase
MSKVQKNWWSSFYDDTPFEVFLARTNPDELKATLDFLVAELGLTRRSRVFDQCCGFGSIGLPLAQRGYRVVGVDLCEKYIRMARQKAATLKLTRADFHVGDAFSFAATPPCDAGFNWYTSFGYSENDDENAKMIERAYASIKPGGKFALEYPNISYLLRTFKPVFYRSQFTEAGEIRVFRNCRILSARGVMTQRWRYYLPNDKTVTKDTTLKLYLPHMLIDIFRRCGFKDVKAYSGFDRETVTIDSPRCIIVGRRGK